MSQLRLCSCGCSCAAPYMDNFQPHQPHSLSCYLPRSRRPQLSPRSLALAPMAGRRSPSVLALALAITAAVVSLFRLPPTPGTVQCVHLTILPSALLCPALAICPPQHHLTPLPHSPALSGAFPLPSCHLPRSAVSSALAVCPVCPVCPTHTVSLPPQNTSLSPSRRLSCPRR